MDPIRFRHRAITKAVTSPLVAAPGIAGGLIVALAVLLGHPAGFFSFLGASGVLFAAGMAATRLIWGADGIASAVYEDYMKDMGGEREAYLERLGRQLERDGDARTTQSLAKLRKLHERLHRNGLLDKSIDAVNFSEIRDKVDQLFWSCVKTLERTLDFWKAASEMATAEARQAMLQQREQLLSEVSDGVGHLEATVDQFRAKQLQEGGGERALQDIQRELDMGLQVARQVEERMVEFERELHARPGKVAE